MGSLEGGVGMEEMGRRRRGRSGHVDVFGPDSGEGSFEGEGGRRWSCEV